MTFHDLHLNFMTFQDWKMKITNSMTFQVFHDLYEPWTLDIQRGKRGEKILGEGDIFFHFDIVMEFLRQWHTFL